MASDACVGQVWVDEGDDSVYMVLEELEEAGGENRCRWKLLVLDKGASLQVPGALSWATDLFFGASWTRRIA